jgi:hypothetical protein
MIPILATALVAAEPPYAPPPEPWYHQAVSCAASAMADKGADPTGEQVGELMTWGLILAETGKKAGRTAAQVDSGDVETALSFYRRLKERKPDAFAAHRAYCRALLEAERP